MEEGYRYYTFRAYPNKKQKELIQKTFGCCRFIYNYFLDRRRNAYHENQETVRFYQCCKELTSLKNEFEWLKEPDKCALQNVLKDLEYAYKCFFEGANYPKYKSKKNKHQSYKTQNYHPNSTIVFRDKHIKIPKIGFVKIKDKRIPDGKILHATISYEANGNYYISLCCKDVKFEQFAKTGKSVGIDVGITNFAIYSDGTKISNPKFYEKSENKIAKLQRELERKTINSSNWNKTRLKLARLHYHIAEQRRDFIQKLTTEIVKEYDVICIENINVTSLRKDKIHNKNKHINDVSFYTFRKCLEYKCACYGKKIIIIDRFYPSSQICNCCGYNSGKKSLNIRYWECPNCGVELDRDINAAINILNNGICNI